MPKQTRSSAAPGPRRRAPAAALAVAALVVTVGGCSTPEPTERLEPTSDASVRIEEGIVYWSDDQVDLRLDACLPPTSTTPTRAVVLAHGGGFTDGDRRGSGMRELCESAAEFGTPAFSIDYRLAPDYRFPSQVDDLANAVRWLREPAQVQRFGIDPARIGLIGSSAGAILVQSVATSGEGPTDTGSRVAAAVSLSGVSLMTAAGLQLGEVSPQAQQLVLGYLGCTSPNDCPQALAASPITAVDPTDPPMLLVNGTGELVPSEQAVAMDAALTDAGVPSELVVVDAPQHGTALLSESVRRTLLTFLEENL